MSTAPGQARYEARGGACAFPAWPGRHAQISGDMTCSTRASFPDLGFRGPLSGHGTIKNGSGTRAQT
eukprot:3697436-Pyramimonas_sp.AAC.1